MQEEAFPKQKKVQKTFHIIPKSVYNKRMSFHLHCRFKRCVIGGEFIGKQTTDKIQKTSTA